MSQIRVAVVDDHEVVAVGVAQALQDAGDFDLVCVRSALTDAASLVSEHAPQIILLDAFLGTSDSFEFCRQLSDAGVRVIIYSGHGSAQLLDLAMRSGAVGYVLKSMPLAQLPAVLQTVAAGSEWWCPELLTEWSKQARGGGGHLFNDRELEIIALIAEGLDNFQIADRLNVTSHTVKFHIAKALRKSGETNRAGLVRRASESQLATGHSRLGRDPRH